jgi:3-methyladenine DNA glycosylase AlkC
MPEALKETLYPRKAIVDLGIAFRDVYPAFDVNAFLARVYDGRWESLELKERMRQVTLALAAGLPDDYRTALGIIRKAAPAVRKHVWLTLSFCDFVEVYGLEDWDASLPALEEFTQLGSAEFAVRPFIQRDPERMLAQMTRWAEHDSEDVRRLASEGSRPRLPWGINLPAFQADPSPLLPILERLKADESESVRRSVANNLNDISKDNPQFVLDVLRRWAEHDTAEIRWVIRHALRTLIKAGDAGALALLGYDTPQIAIRELTLEPKSVPVGGSLSFSFVIESHSDTPQELMIDYVIHLVRARGKRSAKVFKLSKRTLQPGEALTISRNHSFAPISTRRYYPGEHALELQINGRQYQRREFMLAE